MQGKIGITLRGREVENFLQYFFFYARLPLVYHVQQTLLAALIVGKLCDVNNHELPR